MARWLWVLVLYGLALILSPLFGVLESPRLALLWTLGGLALMLVTAWLLLDMIRAGRNFRPQP